jgi:hypothetical protein
MTAGSDAGPSARFDAASWNLPGGADRRRVAAALGLLAGLTLPLSFLLSPEGQQALPPPSATVTLLRLLPPPKDIESVPLTRAPPPSPVGTRQRVLRSQERALHGSEAPVTPAAPADPSAAETAKAAEAVLEAHGPMPSVAGTPQPPGPLLRLDGHAMRQAARDALHQRSAPGYIERESMDASSRLGREIERTAKADCVRPGDSLLSLPRLLLDALKDRCK